MTTTDTDALTERIARELFLCERWNWYDARPDGTKTPEGDRAEREKMAAMWDADAGKPWHESQWPSFRQTYPRLAAAVLPIVAEEARKAKAEALREAARVMGEWACESLVVIGDELDESTWVEMTAGEWLEHRAAEYETGDSDEHR